MSIITKLENILESAENAYSEAVSARENLPDYRANESSKDSMNNTECYLDDTIGDLQDMIRKLEDFS